MTSHRKHQRKLIKKVLKFVTLKSKKKELLRSHFVHKVGLIKLSMFYSLRGTVRIEKKESLKELEVNQIHVRDNFF